MAKTMERPEDLDEILDSTPSTMFKDIKPPIEREMTIDQLTVDPRTQREILPNRVEELVVKYDPMLIGKFTVHRRDNGSYNLLDGQHRVEVLKRRDPNRKVTVIIYEGMSPAQEAEMFLGLNNQATVHVTQRFRVAVTAGHPEAVAVHEIITKKYGLEFGTGVNHFAAVKTAVWISRLPGGLDLLDRTLGVISGAWAPLPGNAGTYDYRILKGIAVLLYRSPHLDDRRLIKVLAEHGSSAPKSIMVRARQQQTVDRGAIFQAVAIVAIHDYNKGLRVDSQRLPLWEGNFSARKMAAKMAGGGEGEIEGDFEDFLDD